ncbi:hypothetical protein GLP31_06285 [Photobacterium carnosum]|uniref:hypothetical protein n=1 Tax=Photobacterium carnosum TaxID=2023717 RepID=UPI001E558A6F|nr:hypothetical protein [Photobacterium carnosum]MCD9552084.1 hypothetical protein [Photobacterium carnosum]
MIEKHYEKNLIAVKIMRNFIQQKILNGDLSDVEHFIELYHLKIKELSMLITLKNGSDF